MRLVCKNAFASNAIAWTIGDVVGNAIVAVITAAIAIVEFLNVPPSARNAWLIATHVNVETVQFATECVKSALIAKSAIVTCLWLAIITA